jgi:methylglutaconyl-CoA hydratase
MTEKLVLTEIDGRGVATVTLNRADVHNAFNEGIVDGLRDAFDTLAADSNVRALLLAARGKSFSAGADLNRMRAMGANTPEENRADALRMAETFDRLNTLQVPTIARIQGSAFAGALGLIAACDIAIAVDTAQFAVTEVRLGLIASAISPYVIGAIGPAAARRYFHTAERFDAAEAVRIGLLHEAVPAEDLDATVEGIIDNILKNAPPSLAACKALIRETAGPVSQSLREETAKRIADIRASDEGREGIAAFFEKRKPAWALPQGEGR